MRINQNIMAFNAYRNVDQTGSTLGKSLEKLSSGFRINRAADDAAGLVISQGLRSQVSGLRQATRNAQDGVSVVQIAEGALQEVHTMLNRIRDLAVQASNTGSNDTDARTAANNEVAQLTAEITRISTSTRFGSQTLLTGTYTGTFQVGANVGDTLSVTISTMNASALGVDGISLIASQAAALSAVTTAITTVSTQRGRLGAVQNRLESVIANLNVTTENLAASEGRIRDTDMALEMVSFTRHQIILQAGTSMLAQANAVPQNILSLLR